MRNFKILKALMLFAFVGFGWAMPNAHAIPTLKKSRCIFEGRLEKNTGKLPYRVTVNEGSGGAVTLEFETGLGVGVAALVGKTVFLAVSIPKDQQAPVVTVDLLSIHEKKSGPPRVYRNQKELDDACDP
ncbi:MAG: hypothetical protein V4760_10110 [Bdellovibrionota bacterium]